MQVIAVVNRKGGVGKTTSAVNIACALALGGQRTLLVDLDPQGSATRGARARGRRRRGLERALPPRRRLPRARDRPPAPVQLGIVCADPQLAAEEAAMLRDARARGAAGAHVRGAARALGHRGARHAPRARCAHRRRACAPPTPCSSRSPPTTSRSRRCAPRSTAIRAVERERDIALPAARDPADDGARAARRARGPPRRSLRERFGELVLPDDIPYSARLDSSALAGVPVVAREPSSPPALAYRAAARGVLAPARPDAAPSARARCATSCAPTCARRCRTCAAPAAGPQAGIGSVGSMPSRPVRSSSSSCSARCDAMSPPVNSTAIS